MKMREYDYIKGNNALNPQRKLREPDREEYEKLKRARKQRQVIINNKKAKLRAGMTQIIFLVFILGMVTIFRDSQVYKIQKSMASIDSNIKSVEADNEALNLDVLKASSLGNVKQKAETNLGMTIPKKGDIIKVDLSQNNFNLQQVDNTKVGDTTLLEKMMDALW
ncbi:cell division protein FtsL [Clostridium sp. 'White wine YQ']|uniref:cell division protein FtsL n=1 Tax=Clostridium sp. 'White wine YQ' TaxID=3027474 RepID=UPI00236600F7|nr:cell division protein FtsL [Clostridium sp. 'White wine YQ']